MSNLSEPIEFIDKIHKTGVKYLLIGRRAVIAYGGPVQTMDYDIYIDSGDENLSLLLRIAEEFELCPSIPKKQIMKHFKFRLENDFAIDVFRAKYFSSGKGKKLSFEELYSRKEIARGETGLEINLPAIDDLIALKELRSSPKDLEDIKYLETIKKL